MKIIKLTSNECGGFKPPKGHLDTQMFPECEGTPTDRNIVKKTVERRKKEQRKRKRASIEIEENIGEDKDIVEAKKKWNPNPWAVCNKNVDKDKNPEKYERCVMDVKKKQAFNLKRYIQAKSN